METTRIQNSQIEQIRVTALDIVSAFITGLTDVLLEIRRESDGYYLDFNDSTFKNSGWTTRQQQMTELDSTYSPGTYFYDYDTTGFSDDNYFIRATSATAHNTPWEGELKVGDYIDNLDVSVSSRASEANATTNTNNIISEVNDNETKIDALQVDLTQVLADIAGLNDLSITDIQTALTNQGYTVVRATKLDNLDATISSRSSHTASDVTTDMDANSVDLNQILADIASLNDVSIADVQTALTNQGYTVVRSVKLDNLDTTVSSRASEANATLNTNNIITEIDENENKIDSIITTLSTLVSDIWNFVTRTLTGIGTSGIASEANATTNKNAIIAEIDANEVKIDSIISDLTAHRIAVEDKIIKILGLSQSNYRFTDQVYDVNGALTSGKISIYANASDADAEINAITSYTITATYDITNALSDYKVTED